MVVERFKLGGIYWPLLPYSMILNDLALQYEGKFYDLEPELKKTFFNTTNIENYKHYREYFLIDAGNPVEGEFISASDFPPYREKVPCDEVFADLDSLGLQIFSRLKSALKYYPQLKDLTENLAISHEWERLGPPVKESFTVNIVKIHEAASAKHIERLYVCADKVIFDAGVSADFAHSFYNLFDLEVTSAHLPESKLIYSAEKLQLALISCSFFGDDIPDLVLALLVSNDRDLEEQADLLGRAFYGLSRLMLVERRAWLNNWVLRLGSEIDRRLESPTTPHANAHAEAVKFAAKAIGAMAGVLAFLEEADVQAFTDQIEKILSRDVPEILEADLEFESAFETLRLTAIARKKFVRDILLSAYLCAGRHIQGRDGAVLKGLLSIQVNSHLRDYAINAGRSARILLRGDPGGGKGAAAKEYHRLVMTNLFGSNFSSFLQQIIAVGLSDAETKRYQKENWYDFLCSILDCVAEIFLLPQSDQSDRDDKIWFLAQIEGTRWRTWSLDPRDAKILTESFPSDISSLTKLAQMKEMLDRIEVFFDLRNNKHKWRAGPPSQRSVILSEYAYRLMSHISSLNKDTDIDWNLFQIACGALGGDGAELRASLRQLFGYAPSTSSLFGAPGLFQICSYVGGTLFLDEVADMPIRMQDNLLVPLEDRKVHREGWETTSERVSTVRFISATHKDLNEAVAEYRRTANDHNPRGFRPDLLTRLATTPPVHVEPISEYFNYVSGDIARGRTRYQAEFSRILAGTKIDEMTFWKKIYNGTDHMLDRFVENMGPAGSVNRQEARREFSRKISMRFFNNIKLMRKECGQNKARLDDLETFILNTHMPQTLLYLLNG